MRSCSAFWGVFSVADRPGKMILEHWDPDRGHGQDAGARRRWIAVRIARTIGPVRATAASWTVGARASRSHAGSDLDALELQAAQGAGRHLFGQFDAEQKAGQVVSQRVQLQPHLVVAEPSARTPHPVDT